MSDIKKNDEKILTLKNQIAEKKKQLDKTKRFQPITNCSIEVDGIRNNIQVLPKDQLILLMVKLNSYVMSAKDLGVLDSCVICGYNVEDWIADINSRIALILLKEEESKLKVMEDKLERLLSNEKKTELEIDEIEALLKLKLT